MDMAIPDILQQKEMRELVEKSKEFIEDHLREYSVTGGPTSATALTAPPPHIHIWEGELLMDKIAAAYIEGVSSRYGEIKADDRDTRIKVAQQAVLLGLDYVNVRNSILRSVYEQIDDEGEGGDQ